MDQNDFTDAKLSQLFADEALVNRYLWCEGMGWMQWTGTNWEHAHLAEIKDVARQWILMHCQLANDAYLTALRSHRRNGDDTVKRLDKERRAWESRAYAHSIGALVSLAQGIVIHDIKEFDTDPYVLNCQNGLVDLRTGEIAEHNPTQLVTKVAAVDYIPGTTHQDWDMALSAIPDDIRPWLQLRFGQAITGNMTPDDRILVLQGEGQNGKSTLMEGIKSAIADYYLQVDPKALLGSDTSVPTELAAFQGVRFAWLEELPRDNVLQTTRIKALAGTTDITARHMREDALTFHATHSLFINTNYPPTVIETDTGTWRRLALVNFPYRYRETEADIRTPFDRIGDPTIRERLRAGEDGQHEAILSWLIEGAVKYHADYAAFQNRPERVKQDTQNWRTNMDLICGYIDERLEFKPDSAITVADLLADFNSWLQTNNQKILSSRKFHDRFAGHELVTDNGVEYTVISNKRAKEVVSKRHEYTLLTASTIRVWMGLAFKSEDTPEPFHHQSHNDRGFVGVLSGGLFTVFTHHIVNGEK